MGAARSLPHRQLRKVGRNHPTIQAVRCRTGSLEKEQEQEQEQEQVRCRTGSRKYCWPTGRAWDCSLPHRQQKCSNRPAAQDRRSLPHRQLRKNASSVPRSTTRSLPHRQLRWRLPARRGFSAVQAVLKTESSTTLSGKFPVAQTPQPRCLPSLVPTTPSPHHRPPDLHPQHPSTAAAQSINAASSPPAPAAAPRSASLPHQTPQAAKSPPRPESSPGAAACPGRRGAGRRRPAAGRPGRRRA